jgi:hypothetical protein
MGNGEGLVSCAEGKRLVNREQGAVRDWGRGHTGAPGVQFNKLGIFRDRKEMTLSIARTKSVRARRRDA